MWIPGALSAEARAYRGEVWRVVEAQARAATMRLADSVEDQHLLEALIEEVKPPLPPDCRHLHWLLAAPFRYGPAAAGGSRFRRAGPGPGVFYAAEAVTTAVAEIAFQRLLFFAESPGTPLPARPVEHTAFSVRVASARLLDLTRPPLSHDEISWTAPADYAACQALADAARQAGIEIIRSASVRDPAKGCNITLLSAAAFAAHAPARQQTWRLYLRPASIQVSCESPRMDLEFTERDFARENFDRVEKFITK